MWESHGGETARLLTCLMARDLVLTTTPPTEEHHATGLVAKKYKVMRENNFDPESPTETRYDWDAIALERQFELACIEARREREGLTTVFSPSCSSSNTRWAR